MVVKKTKNKKQVETFTMRTKKKNSGAFTSANRKSSTPCGHIKKQRDLLKKIFNFFGTTRNTKCFDSACNAVFASSNNNVLKSPRLSTFYVVKDNSKKKSSHLFKNRRKNFLVIGGMFSLFICVLFLSLLLVTIFSPLHSLFLHDDFAQQNDRQVTRFLVTGNEDVFSSQEQYTSSSFITSNEISHLRDVRKLLGFALLICLGSFRLFLACWNNRHYSRKYRVQKGRVQKPTNAQRFAMIAGAFGFLFWLLCNVFSHIFFFQISFSKLFIAFHLLFFAQGNFSFLPTSFLIRTYAQSFFASMAVSWFILCLLLLFAFGLAYVFYLNYLRK